MNEKKYDFDPLSMCYDLVRDISTFSCNYGHLDQYTQSHSHNKTQKTIVYYNIYFSLLIYYVQIM